MRKTYFKQQYRLFTGHFGKIEVIQVLIFYVLKHYIFYRIEVKISAFTGLADHLSLSTSIFPGACQDEGATGHA
jgi:hypothetical protein